MKLIKLLRTTVLAAVTLSLLAGCAALPTPQTADVIYRNGYIYTVDAHDSVQQALAVKDGRIIAVGSNQEVEKTQTASTKVIDLQGKMLMPGLIDAHMHPMDGGDGLRGCNLNYAEMTVAQFQQHIQACLDADEKNHTGGGWLDVTNWFRQGLLPKGIDATSATLDALKTNRPIFVQSSDFHSVLVNTRGMQLAGITAATANPSGGSIAHDAHGAPSGIFEDEAGNLIVAVKPVHPPEDAVTSANLALDLLRSQGVTTFFNALADEPQLSAFLTVQRSGKLTARAYFAPMISTDMAAKPAEAVSYLQDMAQRFDQGPVRLAPTMRVQHAKLFMDGVVQAPAFTAALLEPYLVNKGTASAPHYVAGDSRGAIYLPPEVLKPVIVAIAKAGFNPHIHAVGDRAVREALDAISVMRAEIPNPWIRPAIAHDEVTDPHDYPRFAQLNVTAVMSFQWAKPAADTIEATKAYLGPERFSRMEPEGDLYAAGARIAYGSDWPVDPLNEWFALKVGVTRTNSPDTWGEYPGRINADAGLSRKAVLRAITMNAAYSLHLDDQAGSLEVGKLADMIILDRNFFSIPEEQIANIRVLTTIVGGKVVYQAGEEKAGSANSP